MAIIREIKDNQDSFSTGEAMLQKIADNWGKPFIRDTGNVNKGRIYLDEEKDIYLRLEINKASGSSSTRITFYFVHGDVSVYINYIDFVTCYSDRNPDGTVLYLRFVQSASTSAYETLIAAKDKSGDWACFTKNIMITRNGTFNLGTVPIPVYDISPYSAFVMPNIDNQSIFDGLLKMFTARTKSESNLYVTFNDKPYRVVSTDNSASSGATRNNPSYAFEARQE